MTMTRLPWCALPPTESVATVVLPMSLFHLRSVTIVTRSVAAARVFSPTGENAKFVSKIPKESKLDKLEAPQTFEQQRELDDFGP